MGCADSSCTSWHEPHGVATSGAGWAVRDELRLAHDRRGLVGDCGPCSICRWQGMPHLPRHVDTAVMPLAWRGSVTVEGVPPFVQVV